MRTGKNETDLDFAREFSRPFEGRVYIHPLMPKAFYALLLVLIGSSHFVCRASNSLSATVQNGKSFNAFTKTSLVPEYVRLYTLRAVPPTRHIFFTISLMSLASMRLSTDPANFSPAKSNKTKKTIFTTEIAINSLQMNRSNSTIP